MTTGEPPEGYYASEPVAYLNGSGPSETARQPPHDLEAEAGVIAAVMIHAPLLAKVPELRPEHFFSEKHRRVFEACLGVAPAEPDIVTVATWLRERGRLAQVGGAVGLTELLASQCAIGNVRHYAAIVVERAHARDLLFAAQKAVALLYADDSDLGSIRAALAADLERCAPPPSAEIELLDGPELAAPLPDLDYLVREIGLVAGSGAPHLVAGYGFSGKTLAMQALALSLAAGAPVWGAYRGRCPRKVLHVDFEQGSRLTRRRYQRLAVGMGIGLDGLGDRLAVAVMPALTLAAGREGEWKRVCEGRELVIVDSLRAATGSLDENSSEIRSGLDMLGHVSEATGCRAVVLHHARKPSENGGGGAYSIRGSGAIFDAADSAYLFSAAKGEPIQCEQVKARSHGEPAEDFALVIADVPIRGDPKAGVSVRVHGVELVYERRDRAASAALAERARLDSVAVRRALADTPGLNTRELRAATSAIGRQRLDAALYLMRGEIEIREERLGRAVAHRHYLRNAR